jgi:hypothetical protein
MPLGDIHIRVITSRHTMYLLSVSIDYTITVKKHFVKILKFTTLFRVVTPCRLVGIYRHFGET